MNPLELVGPSVAILVGLLLLWWGIACGKGRFPRNPILGYRTPTTLRSKPAWDAAHRGYAPWIIISSVMLASVGLVGLVAVLLGVDGVLAPAIGIGVAVLFAALIVGGFCAHRSLARYLRENGEHDD